MASGRITLYHGSNMPIERPDVSLNTGFADLGRGFYLTDDCEVAQSRATMRARGMGGVPTVSVYELDEGVVPWVCWGALPPTPAGHVSSAGAAFGLRFDASRSGYVAWASYIRSCRAGKPKVNGLGSPAIVRAWIATMEIEMVCSDFITCDEFGDVVNPSKLVVQYCITSQQTLDRGLAFVRAMA